jgi:hypothetical protein
MYQQSNNPVDKPKNYAGYVHAYAIRERDIYIYKMIVRARTHSTEFIFATTFNTFLDGDLH